MKERILSLLLAFVLIVSMFAAREAILNFVNASDEKTNVEEELDTVREITTISEKNENVEVTLAVQETTKQIEETQAVEKTEEQIEETSEVEVTTKPVEETKTEVVNNEFYDEYFGKEITFNAEYISGDDVMPYVLYTPSTIDETKKTPLIVWLHGSGEVGVSTDTFMDRGLSNVMKKWVLNGFNSYIICPQLTGNWNSGRWNSEAAKNNLQSLLDKFISEHKIDTECVVIVGHSLGGQGAQYMAHELARYFTRCVVLSGYNSGVDINEITIPTIGYVGTVEAGEDSNSVKYMQYNFADTFGKENVFSIMTSHGELPFVVFNFDTDGDSNSDLVEWMLNK